MNGTTQPRLVWDGALEGGEDYAIPTRKNARERLVDLLRLQRDMLPLWGVVLFGFGIGLYFLSPIEPLLYPFLLISLTLTAALLICWSKVTVRLILLGLLIVSLGISIGSIRTQMQAAPILDKEIGPVIVIADVAQTETTADGFLRLTLAPVSIEGQSSEETPKHIRLVVRTKAEGVQPGQTIKLRAVLTPLPTPAAPGAYDFARHAYFEQLGALGYAVSSPEILKTADMFGPKTVERYRSSFVASIHEHLPGENGAIAAALLAGDKTAISKDISAAYRDAGLAHLLAISGLHFGLITGLIYFSARILFALIPRLALNHSIKAYAAIISWFGALGYLLLTGAPLPAQRAFIMVSVMIVGTMLGRQPLSLRVVATAAFVILLFTPEAILNIGFQMSFAAVVTLICAYEITQPYFQRQKERFQGWGGRMALYLVSVALSTVVAEIAIAPIAAYHFNQFASYGVFANMLAVPLTAFWIMPWGALSLFLSPTGLEGLALLPMGWGINILSDIALTTSAAPGAHLVVPQYPSSALFSLAIGGLCLTLFKSYLRLVAVLLFAVAAILTGVTSAPDILISHDGKMVAVKTPDGVYLNTKRGSGFTKNIWQRQWGEEENIYWMDAAAFSESHQLGCDLQGCAFQVVREETALNISYAKTELAVVEDCRSVDILITPLTAHSCSAPSLIISLDELADGGSHALFFNESGDIRVQTARDKRGRRPWSLPHSIQ